MKFSISENADPNYLAALVELRDVRDHPNADRLSIATVFGNQVIVSKDSYNGQRMVYFPVESCINAEYLSWANMYDDAALNADGKTKGYFNTKRRVKAVKLRGEASNGIVIPIEKIEEFFKSDVGKFDPNKSFDTIDGKLFVEKYVAGPAGGVKGEPNSKKSKKDLGISKLLVPNQFKLHGKTTQLGMAVHTISPDDVISVTSKLHGTSAVFANVLCNRVMTWKDKIAKFFGVPVITKEFRFVYSSRTVLKNRRDGTWTSDVWGLHAEELNLKVPAGFTLYGEIVGFTESGKAIQSNYTYGEPPNTSKFYVYRITHTNRNGDVLEFDWQMVMDFCSKNDLHFVPTYYYGKAKDLFDIPNEEENWNDMFLDQMKETYLERPCEICDTGIVREGVCLRNESSIHKNAWKLKSFSFLVKESSDRDKGETNIEEES